MVQVNPSARWFPGVPSPSVKAQFHMGARSSLLPHTPFPTGSPWWDVLSQGASAVPPRCSALLCHPPGPRASQCCRTRCSCAAETRIRWSLMDQLDVPKAQSW